MKQTPQQALCRWFERNARDLPWRRLPTPYRVWVSEIMLQQTRVEAVRDKYVAFLKRFPTARALASAPIEQVLQAWSGLGYYRRARMLHAAARQVADGHGGRVPRDRAALLALPGIGRYTAGAILSIAFKQVEPIVDGNIERVFARMHHIAQPKQSTKVWKLAELWVREGAQQGLAPANLNQSLMELGATVCTPRNPRCYACPCAAKCAAFKAGSVARYPATALRKKKQRLRYLVLAVGDGAGRVLMQRRDQGDNSSVLPAGLWELPHAAWGEDQPQPRVGALSGNVEIVGEPVIVRHSIMDFDVQLAVQAAVVVGKVRGKWFTPQAAENAAIASATRKALVTYRRLSALQRGPTILPGPKRRHR
ncbi:MAG: A/G-specific adenine glycosylase [Planctomycetes bacterium]|nr:A/G-specific adenine glycosylase [Planctomycetota bacterium]